MPFSTATPKSAMNPTAALRFNPRIQSAAMPPTIANGTFIITSSAWRTTPKLPYRNPAIRSMTIGTMIRSRFIARCWFSN